MFGLRSLAWTRQPSTIAASPVGSIVQVQLDQRRSNGEHLVNFFSEYDDYSKSLPWLNHYTETTISA